MTSGSPTITVSPLPALGTLGCSRLAGTPQGILSKSDNT